MGCPGNAGNFGLAAEYIQLLLKYAKSNTDKLRSELATCEAEGKSNSVEVNNRIVKPGAVYTELFGYVEQARELAKVAEDKDGEARDLSILGLSLWSVDKFEEAEKKLRKACATTAGTELEQGSGLKGRLVALALILCTLKKYEEANTELGRADVKFVHSQP